MTSRTLFVRSPVAGVLLSRRLRRACGRRPHAQAVHARSASSAGTALRDPDGEARLHVVFVAPQIHWNTGNIGRTCLGLGAALHLVGPLGFSLDERQIRRAGLDYWEHVDLHVHEDWNAFATGPLRDIDAHRFFFTKFGTECATSISWPTHGKIMLLFGSETDGFTGIRDWMEEEGKKERTVAFPMCDNRFRSFNLSTTASMALWDAYKTLSLAESRRSLTALGAKQSMSL